ncbi:hemolysin family protein [Mailhella massiliensis]|uniref:Hemolysin family protein n=1 Tax=Mailhella massiliensis TaxID=1903261 RepID=A0A921AVU4_9BACT|nr:hemolysin family protein [Mailhella massiliensis]HJD97001.1 hemolysin family protein [Mailhella massiliensis]
MTALIITIVLALSISALCSTMEAMLYSIPWTTLEKMKDSGSRAGKLLYHMRSNVDQPISAILTLNTIANTAGASLAGALAAGALGAENMPYFAALFTLLVLLFGEIIPKTMGVSYPVPLGRLLAFPLFIMTTVLRPATWLSGQITKLITPKDSGPEATEEDINAMARISRQAGVIQSYEETAIRNILALDQKRVHDVMTPRTVVFSLPEDCTVEQAYAIPSFWHFSRIPVYAEDNEDIVGIVLRRDVVLHRDADDGEMKLGDIMQPVHFVLESLTLDKVLTEFLERHQHLFAVLDEFGGLAGVISLEDVMEELLGREIVDESDVAADLRAVARNRRAKAAASARAENTPEPKQE